MEWICAWLVLLVTVGWMVARAARHRAAIVAVAAVSCGAFLVGHVAWSSRAGRAEARRAELAAQLPKPTRARGYVTSDACRACHPSEHASWHRSYHRTMTQVAGPGSVRARFDGAKLVHEGQSHRMERRGDRFFARVEGQGDQEIVMVTGSHHMQAYWTRGGGGNALVEFPFAWLIDEERWVPRRDTFLLSPDHTQRASVWNGSCIECHATAGQPRIDPDPASPDTRVAELGIACEACHGPAHAHVEANESPFRRASVRAKGAGDPTIVNPARLAAPASSQVCGQCHGIGCNLEGWKARGLDYRPGEDLERKKPLVDPARLQGSPCRSFVEARPDFIETRFWPDGLARVSGREHNQMVRSKCFEGGELACVGCHSMHDSDPNDQLARGKDGDGACLGCHQGYDAARHTHHRAGSEGSVCYNCHMPYTTYGLLKAIRSHRIDSPRVRDAETTGRPTACSLCHLDKPLGWVADTLAAWYGQRPPELDDDRRRTAESVRLLLAGDAGQRALVAWSMGWSAAQRASGSDWMAPHVIDRLNDRYAAVRAVAFRSLRTLPSFQRFAYDYTGPAAERAAAAERALATWRASRPNGAPPRPEVLLGGGGALLEQAWDRLTAERDDRDMFLAE
jgi:predicted CXXCH cytochrome family protein